MDDVIMVYTDNPNWDHVAFIRDFEESECYQKPLCLEDAKQGVFLETEFMLTNNKFRFKLKNDNAKQPNKIWRYRNYKSHAPFAQKRAVLTASLKKVHKMASDKDMLCESAVDKIMEFRDQNYPYGVLKAACVYMGASTGQRVWLDIPGLVSQQIRLDREHTARNY